MISVLRKVELMLILLISNSSASSNPFQTNYEIIAENVMFDSPYRQVVRRRVEYPNRDENGRSSSRRIFDFDLVDQPRAWGAVIIFAYNTTSKTATLLREYNPGSHKVLYGPAAGLVDKEQKKRADDTNSIPEIVQYNDELDDPTWTQAAAWELEEECHLKGGKWFAIGCRTAMDKYVITKVRPYLVLDPVNVENPRPTDEEEQIEIVRDIPIHDVWKLIRDGKMNLVGGWASMLALKKLEELNLI